MTDYIVFGVLALYLFGADLLMNRGRDMTVSRAASWSAIYIICAVFFSGYIYATRGAIGAQTWLTAYALEKLLSVDNLIVFSAAFTYFGIQHRHRHRILRWGILGAAALRLVFVCVGTGLFNSFERWMSFVFAVLLVYSAYAIFKSGPGEQPVANHNNRWYTRALRRWWPVAMGDSAEGKFFVQCHYFHAPGTTYWCITPGLLALVAIEISDIIFAVDSVPTVIAVARDPFIVYSSMIFAILGLRAMYFILDAVQRSMRFMNTAVGTVLCVIAVKLTFEGFGYRMGPGASLLVIGTILSVGLIASLMWRKDGQTAPHSR